MTQQTIIMTQKELSRYEIIKNLIGRKINGTEAGKQIGLSVRQVKNIKARVIKQGLKGVIHKNRGRKGNRRINSKIIERVKQNLKNRYFDFQPSFAMEKLRDEHQVKLSKEKVRQIMIEAGLWKPKPRKKNKEYRTWRQRKDYYGEMEQFDGCYYDWLEDRGPRCCLLASIDDATGKITNLKFDYDEGVKPVFSFWKEYVKTCGKPIKIYLDRFSTYKNTHKSAIDNPDVKTQFQRAMNQLNIEPIFAFSPQAKGRVERLFHTLQHRLVREMRLSKISNLEQADKFVKEVFMPRFNAQFSVLPKSKKDIHRQLTKLEKEKLEQIFSRQEARIVNNDFTISYKTNWFQLSEKQPALVRKKEKVLIEERIDDTIFISLRGKYLDYFTLSERPKKIIEVKIPALTTNKSNWKPPADHPWRNSFVIPKTKVKQLVSI